MPKEKPFSTMMSLNNGIQIVGRMFCEQKELF
ncbi:hypothetical protein Mahau_1547 [Mahella australiensis 50-1 BON]|uniref:Uncharacterized protein n=1 Tax=Mahella australiensis (strain DSM 15567 / CIP 107919 / 50-1 BON) TaxID=697281 RepID=F3ZYX7_MAHA5|nr:hypothetical protein Mahau_1547 [Mahella australiensis 50-1 BON]